MLKRILPCTAFYFLNGPWRLLWCRYGHDPHLDSVSAHGHLLTAAFRCRLLLNMAVEWQASRAYQVIDFRMPRNLAMQAAAAGESKTGSADNTDNLDGDGNVRHCLCLVFPLPSC